jgi:hypothetical protein
VDRLSEPTHSGEIIIATIRRANAGFIGERAFRLSGLDFRNIVKK